MKSLQNIKEVKDLYLQATLIYFEVDNDCTQGVLEIREYTDAKKYELDSV